MGSGLVRVGKALVTTGARGTSGCTVVSVLAERAVFNRASGRSGDHGGGFTVSTQRRRQQGLLRFARVGHQERQDHKGYRRLPPCNPVFPVTPWCKTRLYQGGRSAAPSPLVILVPLVSRPNSTCRIR